MSPASRGRKTSTSSAQSRGRHPHTRLAGPARTPDYAKAERRVFGPAASAEVGLLAALSDAWQMMTYGLPAKHWIHAVAAIRTGLDARGADSEPVVVASTVEWANLRVDVGSSTPSREPKGRWSGRLGLWMPSLGRLIDLTLYQANRPQAPAQIERGIIPPMHSRILGGTRLRTAYGASATYRVIDGIHILNTLPAGGRAGGITSFERYRAFATKTVYDDPHMVTIRRGVSAESLASALSVDREGDR